ncbi:hypothetical protein LTR94_035018, partial [Friedmanniomyces endolithicus]
PDRRCEEHGQWPRGGLDHRGPVPATLHQRHAVGAHRHRLDRLGEGFQEPDRAGRRRGIWRASARPHGRRPLRRL